MICCTFAGHREILLDGVEKKLGDALDKLMVQDNGFCFYTGGMEEFDRMCENTVRKYQRQLPEKKIMLVLVEPYMKKSINTDRQRLSVQYDDIIIPTEWADCHYKKAIIYRNQWTIDHSQYLIACVYRQYGGAYNSLKYAKKKGLLIENLCESKTGPRVDAGRKMM